MSARVAVLSAVLILAACVVREPPPTEFTPLPETRPQQIDQVVFLVGDAGKALFDTSPLMVRLREEAERWSEALARPEAVSVLFLGDNVYETGVHDVGDLRRPVDSLHLRAQVEILSGPNFKRWRNRGFFVGGNHDWGNLYGEAGLTRIRNQESMLEGFAKEGIRASLQPRAGLPGPTMIDSGRDVRFVFIDTHWWLQADHLNTLRDTVFFSVNQILRQSQDRALVFVSHHPFASGGAHGGPVPIWRGFGILWLLKKTGSLVQDLNSPVYRELQGGLENLFEEIQRPLIYAGGHDHNLQVIELDRPNRPQWTLVSGSASKTSDVGPTEGMRYGADLPGYMQLVFRTDGGIELHVFAAPQEYQHCGDDPTEDIATCMRDGPSKYEEKFSSQLREPHPIATEGDTVRAR
jgi:hypothetical protein